jgi:hypothetical protein
VGPCNTHGRDEKYIQNSYCKPLRVLNVDGKIILKCILEEKYEDVGWIQLAQKKAQWWGSSKTLNFSRMLNIIRTTELLL